jgi:hypothetical protein
VISRDDAGGRVRDAARAAAILSVCLLGCGLPIGASGTLAGGYEHGLSFREPGAFGPRAQLLLHPSGSRSLSAGVETAWPLATECGSAGGLSLQGLGGWSLLPLPDEARVGGEFSALFGYGGVARREACLHGWFGGGRVGIPVRISGSRSAFELDRDQRPTWYLVPQLDIVRYAHPADGASSAAAFRFSAMLGIRVFFWSRLEP